MSANDPPAATNNRHDLRRSRQRARQVIRELEDDILDYLERNDISNITRDAATERRINQEIATLAEDRLRNGLLLWLTQRRKTTWARAVRASVSNIQTTLGVGERVVRGTTPFTLKDKQLNNELQRIDAGLLTDLADDTADRVTRQIRLGHSKNETVQEIGDRVTWIMTDGDAPDRREKGVTGQTTKTKGELIAHDSVQDGYNYGAMKRYLNNGFRFVVYDAVCDTRTTAMCRRLGECDGHAVVIDLTETPWLVPPNHPWCYHPDTDILTEDGFKHFPELDGSERLFTLDEGGNISLEQPERYIKRPYSGELVHIHTNDFDLKVTPNHETPYVSDWKAKNHDNPPLERKRVEDLSGGDKIPRTGQWSGENSGVVSIGEKEYNATKLGAFLGWYLSEGSCKDDKVCISQSKGEEYTKISKLVTTLFGPGSVSTWSNGIAITPPDALLDELSGLGYSHEKYIPKWFKNLNPQHLRAFLDTFLAGDGHERPGGADNGESNWEFEFNSERVYYTSSPQLADDIGELILKCGNRPSFYFPNEDRYGRTVEHSNGVYETQHPAIVVRECRNDNYSHKPGRATREPYQGFVYCVTMPENPTIYVRRNGKCTWSGNCRSGIRPVLDPDKDAVREEEIGEGHLSKIFQTESYRPTVINPAEELKTTPFNAVD